MFVNFMVVNPKNSLNMPRVFSLSSLSLGRIWFITSMIACIFIQDSISQNLKDTLLSSTLNQVKFRNIGPALMSGRIANIYMEKDQVRYKMGSYF